jgi:hypothetical protein
MLRPQPFSFEVRFAPFDRDAAAEPLLAAALRAE